jgi:hypothetical protein
MFVVLLFLTTVEAICLPVHLALFAVPEAERRAIMRPATLEEEFGFAIGLALEMNINKPAFEQLAADVCMKTVGAYCDPCVDAYYDANTRECVTLTRPTPACTKERRTVICELEGPVLKRAPVCADASARDDPACECE